MVPSATVISSGDPDMHLQGWHSLHAGCGTFLPANQGSSIVLAVATSTSISMSLLMGGRNRKSERGSLRKLLGQWED